MLAAREYNEAAAKNAPGKHYRNGLSLMQLADKFPTDDVAREWFESERWPEGPECPHCGTRNVQSGIAHKTMAHRCLQCEGRTAIRWRGVFRDSDRGILMLGRSVKQDLWLPI